MKKVENDKLIQIKGARVNNLKNISLNIPVGKLIVITGVSGSGKSSLAFDTLFAEGQRRYVESLSSYARQFLGRMSKPDVDNIIGISPAIAIEQKVSSTNPRSTIGTTTEIYDYLKLLFARAGETFSPVSGEKVARHTIDDVLNFAFALKEGARVAVTAPIADTANSLIEVMMELTAEGYQRLFVDGMVVFMEEFMPKIDDYIKEDISILVDRVKISGEEDIRTQLTDSVAQAFSLGNGKMTLYVDQDGVWEPYHFSIRYEADGMTFEEPSEHLFSFNNPLGACPECNGFGKVVGIDPKLVIPDPTKSLYENGVACWRGESFSWWKNQIIESVEKSGFPIHRPYEKLSDSEKKALWKGSKYFKGIDEFFEILEKDRYKIQNRFIKARFTGKRTCELCGGGRLRKEATYVRVGGYRITDFVDISIDELTNVFKNLKLDEHQAQIAARIITEITNRLQYLTDVGLGYLTLNRLSSSLSGGESQRINLAKMLGSSLVGSLYILDEPSIGLHSRDTERLISVLKQLRDIGNTVIVVEHDEAIMRAADHIIDIGPKAGIHGGEVVFQGDHKKLLKEKNSLTAQYLLGIRKIERVGKPRRWNNFVEIVGARENNLKNVDVKFPLGIMTCVTGVSGSGKSSLVKEVLYNALRRHYIEVGGQTQNYTELRGDMKLMEGVEMVDQNPIGQSSRSNPATYIKVYDDIRKLYASLPLAKNMNFTHSSFSFNIAGGRCPECQGDGTIRVEMQFMADIIMECEKCHGRRFIDDILEVKYRDKNIADILDMSTIEAIDFFSGEKTNLNAKIVSKLKALDDVGLGYIKLGQSSSTLSGGESQRVKLASFLLKEDSRKPTIFIFDEPTTGLHFYDIEKLLQSMKQLIEKGNTVIIVEHNTDVIRCSDWLIDLGPEGGSKGGEVVFEGTPDELKKSKIGYTSKYL